jgi:hypothetical protein
LSGLDKYFGLGGFSIKTAELPDKVWYKKVGVQMGYENR